jgi:hypothetical protein
MSSFTPLAITLRYHYTLCAFVCKIKYFDAQIRDNLLYKYSRSFDLLACLGEYATKCLQGNKTRKQLAFLIIFLCIQILHKFQATLCGRINLGAVYTMDHEVVPRPSKRCDWTLKLSRDDLGLHQGKNGRVTTEVEVLKI